MNSESEIRITGSSVSRGVAIGRVVCLYGHRRQFYRVGIDESHLPNEIRRLGAAVRLANRQLGSLYNRHSASNRENSAGILDVQRVILSDQSLLDKIEETIQTERVNAEWAVKLVADGYVAKYKAIADERLRERYIDFEDVIERIFTALGGGKRPATALGRNSILVTRELNPSTLIELAESDPAGIITEHGGWTSHTFILARELNIPAVTGIRKLLRRVSTGDTVIVDGFRGEMIARPDVPTLASYRESRNHLESSNGAKQQAIFDRLQTLDSREVTIRANADIPGGYENARAEGARGIGLYRSEFLFNQFRGVPRESEQIDAYRRIAEAAGSDGVKIRTFDLGLDDLGEDLASKQKNPALGLRAIRLGIVRERQFRTQIRALLQAAHGTRIDIVLPMVSDISEIRLAKTILSDEKDSLAKRGLNAGDPGLGAMIEIPSAVIMINEICEEVDLLCLGTNDLVQYLLAVDRDNEEVADWFRTLSPAVIRSVGNVVTAAEEHSVPLVVCGEMAGSPFYTPLLIGLGAVELSMNAHSIPHVRKVIAGIAYEEAREMIAEISLCRTSDEAESVLRDNIGRRWSHLYPQHFSIT